MTDLIVKLFIKNYNNVTDSKVREKYGILSGCVGIFLNICLFAIKITAGTLSNSISITADAFNNLSDAGSSIVTLIGFKFSSKPADKDHPFGHGRIEYISGLFISMVIIIVGFELLTSSIKKITSPDSIEFSWLPVIIMVIAILIKMWMFLFNKRCGKKINSSAMQATATDSLTDSIATFAVIIGLIFFKITGINADAYLGILVALFIMYSGFSTAKDSLSPLLGQVPDPEFVKEIRKTVLSSDKVLGLHDLIIHDYGPGRCMISLHAEVPANGDILELHDAIDQIEMNLRNDFHCDATIHMDPIQTDDKLTNDLKLKVIDILKNIDNNITMHDFRVVVGITHTNIIFDIAIPYSFKYTDKEIKSIIQDEIKEYNQNYFAVIQVDKKYS